MGEVKEELGTMKVDKNVLHHFHRYMDDLSPEESQKPNDIRQFVVEKSNAGQQEYQIPFIYAKPTATATTAIAEQSGEVPSTSVEGAALALAEDSEGFTEIELEESVLPTVPEVTTPPEVFEMPTAPNLKLASTIKDNVVPLAESNITVAAGVHKVTLLQVPEDNVQEKPTKKRKASSEATIAMPQEMDIVEVVVDEETNKQIIVVQEKECKKITVVDSAPVQLPSTTTRSISTTTLTGVTKKKKIPPQVLTAFSDGVPANDDWSDISNDLDNAVKIS